MSPQILVIDDATDMRCLLRVLLRRDGVTVSSASSSNEGIALALARAPDVILLDLDMPGQSGFDVCKQLKADPRTRSIAIVFVTGKRDVTAKIAALDLGAVDYITKPFDPDELRARVRVALREKRERDMLQADAELDPLSRIANRRAFERHLAARVTAHHALGEDSSLVFVDLDHFKAINDRFGHPFGDRVIQTTAAVLAMSIRPGDIACRIGGEEFALLLAGIPLEDAQRFAERLRTRLASVHMEHEGSPLKITASFGVTATSQFRGRILTAETMTIAADEALYRAKRAGRDCIVA